MREVVLEQYLTGKVERLGGLAWKFVSPGNSGVPDRLIVLPGGVCGFYELKAPGQKPRSLQHRQMGRLEELGVPVGWGSSHAGVDAFLAALVAGRDVK